MVNEYFYYSTASRKSFKASSDFNFQINATRHCGINTACTCHALDICVATILVPYPYMELLQLIMKIAHICKRLMLVFVWCTTFPLKGSVPHLFFIKANMSLFNYNIAKCRLPHTAMFPESDMRWTRQDNRISRLPSEGASWQTPACVASVYYNRSLA